MSQTPSRQRCAPLVQVGKLTTVGFLPRCSIQTVNDALFSDAVRRFAAQFGGASITDPEDAPVPEQWKIAAREGTREAIVSLFKPLAASVPMFVDYVSKRADGIQLGLCGGRGALYIEFPDWRYAGGDFEPGIMVAGVPRSHDELRMFEEQVGRVPPSLADVWRTFSYVSLKNGGCLCDLGATDESFFPGKATYLGQLKDFTSPDQLVDSLRIVRGNGQVSFVLTRQPDASQWDDRAMTLFEVERLVRNIGYPRTIESLLADWDSESWEG